MVAKLIIETLSPLWGLRLSQKLTPVLKNTSVKI